MNKICITGSSGFIASHVSEFLKMERIQVIGLQRHSFTGLWSQWAIPDITYFGDLRDKEIVEKARNNSLEGAPESTNLLLKKMDEVSKLIGK